MNPIKTAIVTLFAWLTMQTQAQTVAFPDSLPAGAMEKRYGPEVRALEQHSGLDLQMVLYSPAQRDDIFDLAQQGLVVASPAQVDSLSQSGLVPVGYHDGATEMVLIGRTDINRSCPTLATQSAASTMGWVQPTLLARAGITPPCTQPISNMANGLRMMLLNQIDWMVSGAITLTRFENTHGVVFERLATVRSPLFAFMTTPSNAQAWLNAFQSAEDAGLTQNGRPVRAWTPDVAQRYRTLVAD